MGHLNRMINASLANKSDLAVQKLCIVTEKGSSSEHRLKPLTEDNYLVHTDKRKIQCCAESCETLTTSRESLFASIVNPKMLAILAFLSFSISSSKW